MALPIQPERDVLGQDDKVEVRCRDVLGPELREPRRIVLLLATKLALFPFPSLRRSPVFMRVLESEI